MNNIRKKQRINRIKFVVGLIIIMTTFVSGGVLIANGLSGISDKVSTLNDEYEKAVSVCVERERKPNHTPADRLALDELCANEARRGVF